MEGEKSFAFQLLDSLKQANKRSFVIILVLLLVLFSTNAYWIWDSSQWEYETVTVDSVDNGIAVYNQDGEVDINGKSDSEKKD